MLPGSVGFKLAVQAGAPEDAEVDGVADGLLDGVTTSGPFDEPAEPLGVVEEEPGSAAMTGAIVPLTSPVRFRGLPG